MLLFSVGAYLVADVAVVAAASVLFVFDIHFVGVAFYVIRFDYVFAAASAATAATSFCKRQLCLERVQERCCLFRQS